MTTEHDTAKKAARRENARIRRERKAGGGATASERAMNRTAKPKPPTPFDRRETLTHKHIQRMTPSELAAIDAEVERLNGAGASTDRTGLIRAALAEYFRSPPSHRTRACQGR